MKTTNIVLMGYGRVGKAFVRLIQDKQDDCQRRYGLRLHLRAVFSRRGGHFFPKHREGGNLLADLASYSHPEKNIFWTPDLSLTDALKSFRPGVWIDCTPSNLKDGEPALGYAHQALETGWHVVTANKGPLVVDFTGLQEKARAHKRSIGMSGAAAAALPTVDVALGALAGTEIFGFEGILNGTANYILTRMGQGMGYAEALREAQHEGIAEPDPSQDVEGWDTAAKVLIIANAILHTAYTLADIRVEGISQLRPGFLLEAKKTGRSIKLLGKLAQQPSGPRLEVKMAQLDPSHPLFGVDGARKGISFFTDTMDSVTVTGGKSDPRGAAAAILKDVINIGRGRV